MCIRDRYYRNYQYEPDDKALQAFRKAEKVIEEMCIRDRRMTEEVMRAEKRAYEKVIRMIAHEVNNTTAGITSTLDTVEQALSTEDDMEDLSLIHI